MKTIPKSNDAKDNYPFWRGTKNSDGKILKPVLFCECGVPCGLGSHSIDENGVVSPSVWHKKKQPYELEYGEVNGCDFHEHIRLEGWDYGAMK